MFRPSWLLHTARMRAPSEIDRFRCTKKKACTMLNTNPLALPLLRVRARTIAAAGGSFRELDGRAEGPDVPEGPGPHRYRAGALIAVAPPPAQVDPGSVLDHGRSELHQEQDAFLSADDGDPDGGMRSKLVQ